MGIDRVVLVVVKRLLRSLKILEQALVALRLQLVLAV
jgi:hypothetical protein